MQAILQRNLIPKPPASDLIGMKGRCWLSNQAPPPDAALAVESLLRQLDFHGQGLRVIDAELGRVALESEDVKRLMTIPGGGCHDCAADRRRGPGLSPLSAARAAGLIPEVEPAGAPVGRAARFARTGHQARPCARPRIARGGRLGRGPHPGARCEPFRPVG